MAAADPAGPPPTIKTSVARFAMPAVLLTAGRIRAVKQVVHDRASSITLDSPASHLSGLSGRYADSGRLSARSAARRRRPHIDASHSHFDAVSIDVARFIWTFCYFNDVSVKRWPLVDLLDSEHCPCHRRSCDAALAAARFDRGEPQCCSALGTLGTISCDRIKLIIDRRHTVWIVLRHVFNVSAERVGGQATGRMARCGVVCSLNE